MKNQVHVQSKFHLMFQTDLSEEEFQNKFNEETIVGSIIQLVTPDGSVHKVSFACLEGFKVEEFEVNEEEKEKPLSSELSDQLAI